MLITPKKIALVYGGFSPEQVISEKSKQNILFQFQSDRYVLYPVKIDQNGWFLQHENASLAIDKKDFSVNLPNQENIKFDGVYMTIHGTPGEDGVLQAYFDLLQIPYSCCGVFESALTFNKYFCNQIIRALDIRVADAVLLRKNNLPKDLKNQIDALKYPCFVKPNKGGSSFATSKINAFAELEKALDAVFDIADEAIVESFISGDEFTVGVYKNAQMEIIALPVTQIISNKEFFDFEAKYQGASQEITPALVAEKLIFEMQSIAKRVYEKLNLKGVCRMDCIVQNNQVFVLEINTTPGMTLESIIPQQCQAANIPLNRFFHEILDQMFVRT